LRTEGFNISAEIDVKETPKKKFDARFRLSKVLSAYHQPLAYQH